MSEYQEFLSRLAEYGIDPKYGLGQNFLYDRDLLDELAAYADAGPNARILEIGAGFGTLTEAILQHYPDCELLSYEIDRSLEARLTDLEQAYPNFHVRWGDAQEADFAADAQLMAQTMVDKAIVPGSLHMIANLPYYITTELMQQVLTVIPEAESICFMVQAEVWERIRALPTDGKVYGPLAVFCHLYGRIEKVKELPAAVFYPAPRVNSIFVRLTKEERAFKHPLDQGDGAAFLDFVNHLLAARRKTLMNNIKRSPYDSARKERILDCLTELGFSAQVRAEKLSPEDFARLFYA